MAELIASTSVCNPAAKLAGTAILAGNFTAMFLIDLVEKDFSYAVASADKFGLSMPRTQAT